MTKSEKIKFKRALKKALFSFKKYAEIIKKREISVSNELLFELYQSITNEAKTLNTSNLNALHLQIDSMINKLLLSNEYLIKSQL